MIADEPLQLVDRLRRERSERIEAYGMQHRADGRRGVGDPRVVPVLAQLDRQAVDRGVEPFIVGKLSCLDEEGNPRGLRRHRERALGIDERLRESASQEIEQVVARGRARAAQQEEQRTGVDRFTALHGCNDGAFDVPDVLAQSGNYNDQMPVVRYVALAALVVWLGGTLQAAGGDLGRHAPAIAYACGAVMLVSLFVMKFVGPPPHGFVVRVALVLVMLGVTTAAILRGPSRSATIATAALGGVLLAWYARE